MPVAQSRQEEELLNGPDTAFSESGLSEEHPEKFKSYLSSARANAAVTCPGEDSCLTAHCTVPFAETYQQIMHLVTGALHTMLV